MRIMIIAAIAALTAGAGQAATIVNGSFEEGVDPGETFITLSAGDSTSITGWTVLANGVDYIGGYWDASEGNRSIDLSALGAGRLSQTSLQDMIAGQSYRISFDMSGNPDGGEFLASLVMSVTGGVAQIFNYQVTEANARDNMLYQTFFYDFTASGPIQDLQFSSLERNPFGPVIDNVRIEEIGGSAIVPEPGTWAMMIAGFGLVGLGARRRRTMARVAA